MSEERHTFEWYRNGVERPLWRLFSAFGRGRLPWFVVGLVAGLFERLASLVPSFVLGVAINAVFNQQTGYRLPLVPDAWIPTARVSQLWLSFGLTSGSFVVAAALSTVRMLTVDYYSHHLMHTVRTNTYDKLQRMGMQFFDHQQKGELMSVLNNDISNFERFFDDALTRAVRIVTVIIGITGFLLYLNWQLAIITLLAVPLLVALTACSCAGSNPSTTTSGSPSVR
ncbi:ABC transporter transmembrane domain-containing protein [Halogeometricum sp. S1BR25-6]|uniref:ABC transporter transmembrane domain-containing protein n=1 Tax=Halogeometricum salsisoli TaxID=2950536 RepID=A0ABU2GIC0_9EURY|nr:ABC transporter transmembrane domain-containing protein [Halogeometricum sp. S1BR25-6]MDS0300573.1 ABC transporter transmembrane domain-containing protein [Halogeometricum sp. S1BR25-6]